MCGRFSNINKADLESVLNDIARDINENSSVWNVDTTSLYANDVRPSMQIAAIIPSPDGPFIEEFTWGLQAPWNSKKLLFNTRIEKASGTDGMWPPIANQFRCLVPATRFWERSREGKSIAFHDTRSALIIMAGVFLDGRLSLVTTTPELEVARFHDRMPLCLTPLQASLWLSNTWKQARFADANQKIITDQTNVPVQPSLF